MLVTIIMIPATLLAVIWLLLLFQVSREDWVAAAFNKVVDNRMEVQHLRRKDAEAQEKISVYSGLIAKVMGVFITTDTTKQQDKLDAQSERLQSGDLRAVNVFEMPGYVLQRKIPAIGMGNMHKKLLEKCVELYGKKYAINKSKQLLARLLSYPIIGVAVSLALGCLLVAAGVKNVGFAVMGIGTLIVLVLVYAMYDELTDRINKRRAAISRQFPNVVSKLALLVTSGMIMDRAWRETADSQELELYQEMRRTSDELANLVDPATAYTNFLNRCNTKETTKLASAIIQNQSKGNAEIGLLLKSMAHEAWQDRRHTAKRDSEKANSKLMIPTMLLFLAILVMIMVPVAMNFASL